MEHAATIAEFWVAVAFVIFVGGSAISACTAWSPSRSTSAPTASRPSSTRPRKLKDEAAAAARRLPAQAAGGRKRGAGDHRRRQGRGRAAWRSRPRPRSRNSSPAAPRWPRPRSPRPRRRRPADVRSAAADAAVAAAETILTAGSQGQAGRRADRQGHRRRPQEAELSGATLRPSSPRHLSKPQPASPRRLRASVSAAINPATLHKAASYRAGPCPDSRAYPASTDLSTVRVERPE